MKLNTLKNKISKTAKSRGHRLSWGEVFGRANGPQSLACKCVRCGMEGIAIESPAPNQINQSGEVLALSCKS
jgi:hypothetical protein